MRLCLLAAAAALLPAAASGGEAPPPGIDLLAGYWRGCVTFSPAPYDRELLAKAAAADPDGLGKRLAQSKVDLGKPGPGWPFYWGNYGEGAYVARTPTPPAGWPGPEFDDAGWPRQRLPLLTGEPRWVQHCAGLACFRARLIVDDPGAVRKLVLHVAYRGGAVVYFNGRELGRGQLPAGQLDPEAPAEAYPPEAYRLPALKLGNYDSGGPRVLPELWGPFPGPTGRLRSDAATLGAPVDDLTSIGKHGRGDILTRKEWETIAALRDRRLGPLEVPAALIRKGTNVVALEIHRSALRPLFDAKGQQSAGQWQHCYLMAARVECQPAGAVLPEQPPAAPAAWTEDLHQRGYDLDRPPAGAAPGPLRMVGARNGVFSAQAMVWSGTGATEVKASAGELAGPGGARIPAAAVEVRCAVPHPAAEIDGLSANLQGGRGLTGASAELLTARYSASATQDDKPAGAPPSRSRDGMPSGIGFYDHLAAAGPAQLPAGRSLPVWVTVRVPAGAAPGRYEGSLAVSAGAARFEFPLRLQVVDWKLPDPAGLTTVMALEPSPYGVARQYQAPLWSDKHFKLMEASFQRLAEIGNDMVVVPVLLDSEFGNGADSMIRWKRGGGKTEIDFAIAERYLDLVKKHLQPRCVCFVVCHSPQSLAGGKQKADQPQVAEAGAGGKLSPLAVPAPGTPQAQEFWRPLVEGLTKRMADRGMAKALHWGYVGDAIAGTVNSTIKDFARLSPTVGWARGAHGWDQAERPFSFGTTVRIWQSPVLRGGRGVTSHSGWKQPGLRLVFTRVENGAAVVYGFSGPIRYRLAPEQAIWSGCHGIGRWGADCWAGTYAARFNVTPTVLSVLWPGPDGAEGSQRFECLREGLQETEARILLEKKLEDKAYAASPAGKAAQEMLDDRIRAGLVQVLQSADNTPQPRIEECFWGWQEASWDLYAAAAAAAGGRAPYADEKRKFFGP